MENIFQKKADRQTFFARYENNASNELARLALGAFDMYLKNNYPNVSESAYFEQLSKANDHTLYTEVDRLVQYWYTYGVREKSRRKVGTGLSSSSVKTYFSFVKAWFRANGIKLDSGMIKDYVRWRKPLKEKRRPLDKETARLLIENMNYRYRGYYKFILMNGIRLGREALNLEVRDIDFNFDPPKITIRAEIAKTKTERVVFVDSDTARDIMRYNVKDKKPTDKVFDFTYNAFYFQFWSLRKKLGLVEKYHNNWNYKINPYKARKFARTRLSAVDKDFAEALLGHENISNLYYEKTDEELGKIYKTAIPELSLSDEKRLKSENETLRKQASIVDSQQLQIQIMQDQIKRLQDIVKNKS